MNRLKQKWQEQEKPMKKAVNELKKLYDIRKAYQRDELLKALETSHRSYNEILAFIEGRDGDIDW